MASKATSFRLDAATHQRLRDRAEVEDMTVRAMLEQLVDEGIQSREHPGIVHRGRPGHRRAALAGGPDVWEVIDALRFARGSAQERIEAVAAQMDLHARQVMLVVDYAAAHSDSIDRLIADNDASARDVELVAEARARYLTG